uniref:Putative secreted protein n=1 Tax=Ixodes ricinus TaxID=34613 RepID=A0A6B0U7B8_IXORI
MSFFLSTDNACIVALIMSSARCSACARSPPLVSGRSTSSSLWRSRRPSRADCTSEGSPTDTRVIRASPADEDRPSTGSTTEGSTTTGLFSKAAFRYL